MESFYLERLADLICGDDKIFAPVYRSSWYLTQFFASVGLPRFKHDGTTRKWWVVDCLRQCSSDELKQIVIGLASPKTYGGSVDKLRLAIKSLNEILSIEGFLVKLDGVKPVIIEIEPQLIDYLEISAEKTLQFEKPNFDLLGFNQQFSSLLESRWVEIEKCLQSQAFLASIILMGSFLEGILYLSLSTFPENANRASASPKDPKSSKPKPINEWSLSQMIDVAYELGWLGSDVKKFSHSLREFRNLVHPFQQAKENIYPDEDTCKISWQVIQASMNDLTETLSALKNNG